MKKRWKKLLLLVIILPAIIGTYISIVHANQYYTEATVVENATEDAPERKPYTPPEHYEVTPENLLFYTNKRRAEAGVPPVTLNPLLNQSAQAKAEDMAAKNYWAHNTPDGSEPWKFITAQGYSYSAAGENLACSFNDSKSIVTGWWNSPTHKANLINPLYTEVGFGIVKDSPGYKCADLLPPHPNIAVQHFGRPYGT